MQSPVGDAPQQIPLDVLVSTYSGLTVLSNNYVPTGEGWRTIMEARQLVEVEASNWYGYEEWRATLGLDC